MLRIVLVSWQFAWLHPVHHHFYHAVGCGPRRQLSTSYLCLHPGDVVISNSRLPDDYQNIVSKETGDGPVCTWPSWPASPRHNSTSSGDADSFSCPPAPRTHPWCSWTQSWWTRPCPHLPQTLQSLAGPNINWGKQYKLTNIRILLSPLISNVYSVSGDILALTCTRKQPS